MLGRDGTGIEPAVARRSRRRNARRLFLWGNLPALFLQIVSNEKPTEAHQFSSLWKVRLPLSCARRILEVEIQSTQARAFAA